jgi:hypothetical protein
LIRILILFFLAVPVQAQVVELAGGSSTLYQSSGALATIHFPNSTMMVSAGTANGRLGLGFADAREFHGWDISVGDKQFSTADGGSALGIMVRGLSATRHSDTRPCPLHPGRRGGPIFGVGAPECWVRARTLTIFAGGTGPSYAAPYFSSATTQHIGAGIFLQQEISHGLKADFLAAVAGSKRSAVGALTYRWRILRLSGAGGVLENSRYWNASLDLQPAQWASFSAARTTYSFSTVNSASGSVLIGALNFHGSAFASGHTNGESFGAGARLGRFEMRGDIFRSRYGTNRTGMLGEKITRRFSITQFFSNAGGHTSVNVGGEYHSNQFALSVGYQTYFMPLQTRQPFQRTLAVQISFRLPHDSSTTISTNLDPQGKIRYSVYGNTFAYGALGTNEHPASRIKGAFVIRGTVTDSSGAPVVGAAMAVGNQIVYSNSSGEFTARIRRNRPAFLRVSLDDFAAPGNWRVVDCPATAQPDQTTRIVVEKY